MPKFSILLFDSIGHFYEKLVGRTFFVCQKREVFQSCIFIAKYVNSVKMNQNFEFSEIKKRACL